MKSYNQVAVMPIAVNGRIFPEVVVAIRPQSSSTMWKWWMPTLGLEHEGNTRVVFGADTLWQHKCDVSNHIKETIANAFWTREP